MALVEDERAIVALEHERTNAHAEALLPLVDRVLAEAGLTRSAIDRLAVGIGPGSFTGLRVGIALAQGIALGLDRPVVGVGSLSAMARAVPHSDPRVRVAVLDARRGELFLGAYDVHGDALMRPCAVLRERAAAHVIAALGDQDAVAIGEAAAELGPSLPVFASPESALPHATFVALLGVGADMRASSLEPDYVRDSGATLPNLPPSPLREPGA